MRWVWSVFDIDNLGCYSAQRGKSWGISDSSDFILIDIRDAESILKEGRSLQGCESDAFLSLKGIKQASKKRS